MEDEKVKTADEYASKAINKLVGISIAKRKLQIKKLEVEIAKLKSGEMLPEGDVSASLSSGNQTTNTNAPFCQTLSPGIYQSSYLRTQS
jgi:hypothetical protein